MTNCSAKSAEDVVFVYSCAKMVALKKSSQNPMLELDLLAVERLQTQNLLVLILVFLLASPTLLVAKIRHDRQSLQERARAFLARPVPKLLQPDVDGYMGYQWVGTNEQAELNIFGRSHQLIERYATNGRIRWSAVIQGQFAVKSEHLYFPGADELERTNEEVRAYLAERNAILSDEWRMGFWQWIEDTIELKQKIPEHEEEDFHPASAKSN